MLQWMKDRLTSYEKDQERLSVILERGGLEGPIIDEYRRLWKQYLGTLARNPKQIVKTHELQAVGRLVTIGSRT